MINKIFSNGNKNTKSDFYIEFKPNDSNKIDIKIQSKNNFLFGSKIKDLCLKVCKDLDISGGAFLINDNGGQYFTLQARLEATIKSAWPNIKSESFMCLPIMPYNIFKHLVKKSRCHNLTC